MKPPGILVEIALNLNINLGGTVNLKIETYDNEHGIFPFYLELLSFLSTIFCNFHLTSLALLLLRFLPKYFIVSEAIVSGIAF